MDFASVGEYVPGRPNSIRVFARPAQKTLDRSRRDCYSIKADNKVGALWAASPGRKGGPRSIKPAPVWELCVFYARGCVLHPCFFCSRSHRSRCNQWRCVRIATANYQINEEIRDKEVRVIGADGAQLGIMSSAAALEIAEGKDLDLVKIAPGSNPPVCKIMDYGKYRFEQAKREKEARKNQHVIEVKEIRMSPGIGENDFNTKLKNGQKFLQGGDRLKVTIRFRGREMAHTNIGEQLLRDFAAKCADIANLDKQPKLEGRNMSMFLSPKPQNTNSKK